MGGLRIAVSVTLFWGLCSRNNTPVTSLAITPQCRVSVNTYCNDQSLTSVDVFSQPFPENTATLQFAGNLLTFVPGDAFVGLSQLNAVTLSENDITSIEMYTFANLSNLTDIALNNNAITWIGVGAFEGLIKLVTLQLDFNLIDAIPINTFRDLTSLETLYLESNRITIIQQSMLNACTNLQFINMDQNSISHLDTCAFGSARALDALRIADNKLTSIDTAMLCNATTLRVLSLNSNPLGGLPDRFLDGFPLLQQLDIGNVSLVDIPVDFFSATPEMYLLTLNNNPLFSLPEAVFDNLAQLNTLKIDNCNLTSLPPSVFNRNSLLNSVLLNNNNITFVRSDLLYNISSLGVLQLSNNAITFLPSGLFTNASSVYSAHLSNNRISYIENGVFHNTSLEFLYLEDNEISVLPPGMFAGSTSLYDLYLSGNQITFVSNATFNESTGLGLLYLSRNKISAWGHGIFRGMKNLNFVNVSFNNLQTLDYGMLFGLTVMTMFDASSNGITFVHSNAFGSNSELSTILLSNNSITMLENHTFGYLPRLTMLDLSTNDISMLTATALDGLRLLNSLNLSHNRLTHLESDTFSFFHALPDQGNLLVDLSRNNVSTVDSLFNNFTRTGSNVFNLQHNAIDVEALLTMLQSFTNSSSTLTLMLENNNIAYLPGNLMSFIGSVIAVHMFDTGVQVPSLYPSLTLFLGANPITYISQVMFDAVGSVALSIFKLDIAGINGIETPNSPFFFAGWAESACELLSVNAEGTALEASFVNLFADNPCKALRMNMMNNQMIRLDPLLSSVEFDISLNLSHNEIRQLPMNAFQFEGTVDLAYNTLTMIPAGAFNGSKVRYLNMSHNNIEVISPTAFNYTFFVLQLYLEHNNISIVPQNVLDNLPGLNVLDLRNNQVAFLPVSGNHIAAPRDVVGNILQCDRYGPQLQGCTCAYTSGLVYSEHCGYGRCMPSETGCDRGALRLTSNCSAAPLSICIYTCDNDEYFDGNSSQCLPVTDCSAVFEANTGAANGGYLPGYQFQFPTLSTNRLCSICPVCDPGFETIPCTATSSTQCVKLSRLSTSDIALIVMAVVLPVVLFLLLQYLILFRKRSKAAMVRLGATRHELELTEKLLGGYREENQRMLNAWEIAEADIHLEQHLATGSYGAVWRGVWGHIPVAVKRLKAPLDDLDRASAEDFEREVLLMQSIRHPNVLIFYGAGVTADGNGFLVVELMALGSLRALLKDTRQPLDWHRRWLFASDIARGMKHLHGLGMLHRDLKSDNCLVDERRRVKVADFGNGKLVRDYKGHRSHVGETNVDTEEEAHPYGVGGRRKARATMTRGVGTLLWMAPELLQARDAKTLPYSLKVDVYSFAIVMWEIWARADPWDNLDAESYISFFGQLQRCVTTGVRPLVPPADAHPAPVEFVVLMKACWHGDPNARPAFSQIVNTIEDVANANTSVVTGL
eukprot:m.1256491 g.1256491  ORF g.1256491 m.1256491 type:complete len:1443 (+) comp24711_c0_seq1:673-5001(+)